MIIVVPFRCLSAVRVKLSTLSIVEELGDDDEEKAGDLANTE